MDATTSTLNSDRKAFQGISNIIRFNWHWYVIAIGFAFGLLLLSRYLPATWSQLLVIGILLGSIFTLLSLLVSWYIYDLSGLYTLNWLQLPQPLSSQAVTVTIHAGFDETSALLKTKFKLQHLHVFDFYDPRLHTEWSVKRARKAYPPYPGTVTVTTGSIPLPTASCQVIFLLFAAHEIRNETERIQFFRELKRLLQPGGCIVVTEHLRDLPNSIVYTLGALHFHSRTTWLNTFSRAGLHLKTSCNINPFITTFILHAHDTTPSANR